MVSILLSFSCSLSSLPVWESVPVCGLEPHEFPYRPDVLRPWWFPPAYGGVPACRLGQCFTDTSTWFLAQYLLSGQFTNSVLCTARALWPCALPGPRSPGGLPSA
nr:MAG TPA: hypothetical protein [Caudoviricetes sp.]